MEINGLAHVILTVRDLPASRAFYAPLLEQMGLHKVVDRDDYLYYVGGRTAVGLRPAAEAHREARFDQGRVGLHHLCFRARSREDVDAVFACASRLGASIVHPPGEAGWVPGYYSVLFEDPDGIRLEVNYIPGKGVFDPGVQRLEQSEPRESGGATLAEQLFIENLYRAFNDRDVESALSLMHFDVQWPNGMEGGIEVGHHAVRDYWARQWMQIDPRVEPLDVTRDPDGRLRVAVRQLVRDLTGKVLNDRTVHHLYAIEDGLVRSMEIVA